MEMLKPETDADHMRRLALAILHRWQADQAEGRDTILTRGDARALSHIAFHLKTDRDPSERPIAV